MQFTLLASILFVTSIAAAPIEAVQNDVSIISRAVSDVNNKLKASIVAVESLRKAPSSMDLTNLERDIERKAQDVSTATQVGANNIRHAPEAGLLEAQSLIGGFNDMVRLGGESCDAYIRIKPIVLKTQGGREAILRILTDHLANAGAFSDALKSRLPSLNAQMGTLYYTKTSNDLKRAISSYQSRF